MKDFYTQEEAARLLRYSTESVLEQMLSTGPWPLYPAVNFTVPVRMEEIRDKPEQEEKSGLFDLFIFGVNMEHGRLPLHEWSVALDQLSIELPELIFHYDRCGVDEEYRQFLRSHKGIVKFVSLCQEEKNYLVCEPKSVHMSELLVSRESLEAYAIRKGITLAPQSDIETTDPLTAASQVLSAQRTVIRDGDVNTIIERIKAERPQAVPGHTMINHLRFMKEAGVSKDRFDSVKKVLKLRIDEYFNGYYCLLSRPPKTNVIEPYFLPPNKVGTK